MGKFKRNKKRNKQTKTIMDIKLLLDYIKKYKDKIENASIPNFSFRENKVNWGDRYYSEYGNEYILKFKGNASYIIGEIQILEYQDDYAQAEAHTSRYCVDFYQNSSKDCLEVYQKLEYIIETFL